MAVPRDSQRRAGEQILRRLLICSLSRLDHITRVGRSERCMTSLRVRRRMPLGHSPCRGRGPGPVAFGAACPREAALAAAGIARGGERILYDLGHTYASIGIRMLRVDPATLAHRMVKLRRGPLEALRDLLGGPLPLGLNRPFGRLRESPVGSRSGAQTATAHACRGNCRQMASGRRVSNPRPSAWEADALPTELRPRWIRRLPPASAPGRRRRCAAQAETGSCSTQKRAVSASASGSPVRPQR